MIDSGSQRERIPNDAYGEVTTHKIQEDNVHWCPNLKIERISILNIEKNTSRSGEKRKRHSLLPQYAHRSC